MTMTCTLSRRCLRFKSSLVTSFYGLNAMVQGVRGMEGKIALLLGSQHGEQFFRVGEEALRRKHLVGETEAECFTG